MEKKLGFVFVFGLIFFLFIDEAYSMSWDSLKVTFMKYDTMPLTTEDAERLGWKMLDSDLKDAKHRDCNHGGLFNGFRYFYNGDLEYNLLFDVKGRIAGSQMNLLEANLYNKTLNYVNTYKFKEVPSYISNTVDGNAAYTLTTYYVDPAIICTKGRGRFQAWREGVGKNIYFQQGDSPNFFYLAPKSRDEAVKARWSKSGCFRAMGWHSYFGIDTVQQTNCDLVYPYTLLFNKDKGGELLGFLFLAIGHTVSPRFEHPSPQAVVAIFGNQTIPCMKEVPLKATYSQMHHYFTPHPDKFECPIK